MKILFHCLSTSIGGAQLIGFECAGAKAYEAAQVVDSEHKLVIEMEEFFHGKHYTTEEKVDDEKQLKQSHDELISCCVISWALQTVIFVG